MFKNATVLRHCASCLRQLLPCLPVTTNCYQRRFLQKLILPAMHIKSIKRFPFLNRKYLDRHTDSLGVRHITNLIPSPTKQITTQDRKKFLTENKIAFEEGYTCFVTDCKLCAFSRNKEIGKLYINRTTGMFLCLQCKNCGSWDEFKEMLTLVKKGEKITPYLKRYPQWLPPLREVEPIVATYNEAVPIKSLDLVKLQEILEMFDIQMLGKDILESYEARVLLDSSQLLFPIYAVDGTVVGMHIINSGKGGEIEVVPRHLIGALFGWNKLSSKRDTIIVASTPFDCLAIAQEVNIPVVSLLNGKSLPLEVLPLLEAYSKIILWLGDDVSSWELSKMFARKLNDCRCFFVRPQEDHPRPLEALRSHFDVNLIMKSAHPLAHKAIISFHSLRQDVLAELSHAEQVAGIKWKRYPLLTKLLKGHRRGEMTVFTGPTGSGKTTFISEYSLDLCLQGVRTLWGSFEIQNLRLAKMMLTQFAMAPLEKHLEKFDQFADQFEKLPLYFLTFHGPQNIRNVLDAMRHAVYVHDIEHVVVDNLQFLLGTSESPYIHDRFWKQDLVISSFRQFATVHNCHVSLVIHPRKESTDELNIFSIFGGAKASQEADNVLILQDMRLTSLKGRKYVQVTKNRFDGDLGIVPLHFDKETLSFTLKKKINKGEKESKSENVNSNERKDEMAAGT